MNTLLDPSRYIAIVLCAGLGTRLRPLTQYVPKTAVPLGKWPLAFYNVQKLIAAGLDVVHCNTHFLGPLCEEELERAARVAGLPHGSLHFWREEALLETGGGIARIARELALREPEKGPRDVIVISGDIHGDVPLSEMVTTWEARPANVDALLCSRALKKAQADAMWVNLESARVAGFGRDLTPEIAAARGFTGRNFSGHQILSHALALSAPAEKNSSVDAYFRTALLRGKEIAHVDHPESLRWFNVGTYAEYRECMRAKSDDLDWADQAVPTHCLVALPTQKKSKEGVCTFLGSPALFLPLCPWPYATLRLSDLRTFPSSDAGDSLATILPSRILSSFSSPAGTSEISESNVPFSSSPSFDPAAVSSHVPLVFRLTAPSVWKLSHPLLVPLEVMEAAAPLSLSRLAALYEESETFLVLTPAR